MRINFIKQPLASSRLPRCDPCERQESHHPEAFPRSIVLDWRAPRSMLIDCQNYFGPNSKLSADLRTKMHVRTLKKTRLQAGAIFHRTHRGCPSPAHSPRRNRTARGSVPATGYQEVPPYCGAECNLDRSLVARVVSLRARARASGGSLTRSRWRASSPAHCQGPPVPLNGDGARACHAIYLR